MGALAQLVAQGSLLPVTLIPSLPRVVTASFCVALHRLSSHVAAVLCASLFVPHGQQQALIQGELQLLDAIVVLLEPAVGKAGGHGISV